MICVGLLSESTICDIRFHWKTGTSTSEYSSYSGSRYDEWYTVELLETANSTSKQQQRTRFAIDEPTTPYSGGASSNGSRTPRTPSTMSARTPRSGGSNPAGNGDGSFSATKQGAGDQQGAPANVALDMFLRVGYWVTTSSPSYLPTVLGHLNTSGGVLLGMHDARGSSTNERADDGSDDDTDEDDADESYGRGSARSQKDSKGSRAPHQRSTADDYDLSGSDKCFLSKVWLTINASDQQLQQSTAAIEIDFHHCIFNVFDAAAANLRPMSYTSHKGVTKYLYRPSSKRSSTGWTDEFSGFQVARGLFSKTLSQFCTVRVHDSSQLSSEVANSLARKQIAVLGNMLADLASEGGRVRDVCGAIQALINSLPGVHSTSLIIKDSFDGTVLFEKTTIPSVSQAASTAEPPTPMPGAIKQHQSSRVPPLTSKSTITKSFFPDGGDNAPTTPGTAVRTGGDGAGSDHHAFNFSSGDIAKSPSSGGRSPKKLFIDTGAEPTQSSTMVDLRPETELAFDCFEVSGKFIVQHKHRHELEEECSEKLLLMELDLPELVPDICRKLPAAVSASLYATNVTGVNYVSAVRSILQIVSRALGRRVFEIMRDRKHKKLLAENADQINLQRTRISESEASRSDLLMELDKAGKDAARLRALLVEEQEDCRKATSRSKTLDKKLAQTVQDLKEESNKNETALRKALNTAREERRLSQEKADKCARELARAQEREKIAEKAKRDGIRELEELEKQFKRAGSSTEETIRKLRQELQQSKADLQQALSREIEKTGDSDSKLRNVLNQLQKSVEEVAVGR
jgi:hypothetical protein